MLSTLHAERSVCGHADLACKDRLAFAIFDTAHDENYIVRRKVSCTHIVNQTFAHTPRQLLLATTSNSRCRNVSCWRTTVNILDMCGHVTAIVER